MPISAGAYATRVEPFWLQSHDVEIPIASLPSAFDGLRILHVSDLHAGPIVPFGYLQRAIETVNATEADVVMVTGDLVTHALEWVGPTCALLGTINKPTYVSLGNHDYSEISPAFGPPHVAEAIQDALDKTHCVLLRNRAVSLERKSEKMWIVGLEDFYTPLYAPTETFASFKADAPMIVMSHNPDSIEQIAPFRPALMLSGHTHGGQVRLPLIGAPILPIQSSYDQGLFDVNDTKLFVSRGIGFLKQIRLMCRPELPRLILKKA
ncbi:MAG TPA: metallophosphoesterase [Tepidisphaeraceae bacterium]|nr:metallophosphoesterase [Tepidisphaeraceae bacterium]